jgi:hypothetical protein
MPQFVTVTPRHRNGDGSKGALYKGNPTSDRILRGPDCNRHSRVCADASSPFTGYPGGLIPMAIGTRFSRHDRIYRSDVVENQTHQPNPGDGIEPVW